MVQVKWAPNFQTLRTQIERKVLTQIEQVLIKAVGNVRCAKHNKDPEVHVSGKSLDQLDFQVAGCCDEIIEKVEGKLSNL